MRLEHGIIVMAGAGSMKESAFLVVGGAEGKAIAWSCSGI